MDVLTSKRLSEIRRWSALLFSQSWTAAGWTLLTKGSARVQAYTCVR